MDKVDASAHYQGVTEDKPSLLVVVLDTNPFAWQSLHSELPLQTALSHILLFLNAHLSFSHANRVAVIASHTKSATFLYPNSAAAAETAETSVDLYRDANKYRLFASIERQVQSSMQRLLSSTAPESLAGTNETTMAGALSLALAYINRVCNADNLSDSGEGSGGGARPGEARADTASMTARILVVSVSGDLANQYVSVMNSIFAAQRQRVPIDICKIAGDTVFLQQASDSTNGIYMQLQHPSALLQYLLSCFMSDPSTRHHLIPPSQINVDFRAACFCHKRVVDIGFVCSICLSIFCSPPPGAICTTCNTKLDVSALGNYGGKPAVVLMKKKKIKKAKKVLNDSAADSSTPGTPVA
ncbi:TFIIH subunit Tfb4/p34 [Sphaerosporella brunnea]|uniref:General transcription and DNA repair factor IIH subunit TFB4 n=1 Tax=Sphaerosporella brunnea TaxID=1250544 RepID=A0A5J5EGI5_9PEZI|nr:TFIIH subunit Tfb4/p34 [Sphaerosporella brunnea]